MQQQWPQDTRKNEIHKWKVNERTMVFMIIVFLWQFQTDAIKFDELTHLRP